MEQKQKLNVIYRMIWHMVGKREDCYRLCTAVLRYLAGEGIQNFDDVDLKESLSAMIDLLDENIIYDED